MNQNVPLKCHEFIIKDAWSDHANYLINDSAVNDFRTVAVKERIELVYNYSMRLNKKTVLKALLA